jgi:hypothetical protein
MRERRVQRALDPALVASDAAKARAASAKFYKANRLDVAKTNRYRAMKKRYIEMGDEEWMRSYKSRWHLRLEEREML